MKRTPKRVIAFFLTLVLMLSLCACAQKTQAGTEADKPNINAAGEALPNHADRKIPVKQPGNRKSSRRRRDFLRKQNNLSFGCGTESISPRPCSA